MPWRRRADTLFRRAPDGVLVISLGGGDPIWLSAPGDAIWALLDAPLAIDELVERLADQFGAPVDTVRTDCLATLNELEARGLVESVVS